MAKIEANKKTLIRWKVYVDRAKMYIGYIQFLMIAFVLLEAYKDTFIGQLIFSNMLISIPIIFLVFILLSLIIGRLDTLLGFREEELRNASTSNPVMREILSGVKEIQKDISEIKNQSNSSTYDS